MSMRRDLNRSRPTGRRRRWSGDGGRRPSAAANAACCATRGERTVAKGRRPEHCAILCGHGMQTLIDILLQIDVHLDAAIQQYGTWTYALLFAVAAGYGSSNRTIWTARTVSTSATEASPSCWPGSCPSCGHSPRLWPVSAG